MWSVENRGLARVQESSIAPLSSFVSGTEAAQGRRGKPPPVMQQIRAYNNITSDAADSGKSPALCASPFAKGGIEGGFECLKIPSAQGLVSPTASSLLGQS